MLGSACAWIALCSLGAPIQSAFAGADLDQFWVCSGDRWQVITTGNRLKFEAACIDSRGRLLLICRSSGDKSALFSLSAAGLLSRLRDLPDTSSGLISGPRGAVYALASNGLYAVHNTARPIARFGLSEVVERLVWDEEQRRILIAKYEPDSDYDATVQPEPHPTNTSVVVDVHSRRAETLETSLEELPEEFTDGIRNRPNLAPRAAIARAAKARGFRDLSVKRVGHDYWGLGLGFLLLFDMPISGQARLRDTASLRKGEASAYWTGNRILMVQTASKDFSRQISSSKGSIVESQVPKGLRVGEWLPVSDSTDRVYPIQWLEDHR